MKLFKKLTTPTARKRLISAALAVATLITALVVVPITLTTEVEAKGAKSGAYSNSVREESTVFYASEWQDYMEKNVIKDKNKTDAGGIFGLFEQTNVQDEQMYDKTENAFSFRYNKDRGITKPAESKPYVFFHPNRAKSNYYMTTKEYKYITITYTVKYTNGNINSDCLVDLQMKIYPLTKNYNPTTAKEELSYTADIVAPATDPGDGNRIYHTVIFDLSQHECWQDDWIEGFRFDYFNNCKYVKDHPTNNNAYTYMRLLVDSIGFFTTAEAAKYHADERDWQRNHDVVNPHYPEDHNNRNVYYADSLAWGGYIPNNTKVDNLNENASFSYNKDVGERAWHFKVTGKDDPKAAFIINGNRDIDKNGSNETMNHVDRSLSRGKPTTDPVDGKPMYEGGFNYVAISYKLHSNKQTKEAVKNRARITVFLLYEKHDKLHANTSNGVSRQIVESYDQYQVAVFDLRKCVTDEGGDISKIKGIRIDAFDYEGNQTGRYEADTGMFISAIGFFKTPEEAQELAPKTYTFDADYIMNNLGGAHHNITASKVTVNDEKFVKLTVKQECETCEYCVHKNNEDPRAPIAIDPHIAFLFNDGLKICVDDYQYVVVEYMIQYDDENKVNYIPDVCPDYKCTVHDGCLTKGSNPYTKNGYVPIRFFPTYLNNNVHEQHKKFYIDQKQYDANYNRVIRCALSVENSGFYDSSVAAFHTLTGFRFDPFDAHYARIGSSILIKSVSFICREAEAKGSNPDQYVDQYMCEITVNDNMGTKPEEADLLAAWNCYFIADNQISNLQKTEKASVIVNKQLDCPVNLTEDTQYIRPYYEFLGWKAYQYRWDSGTETVIREQIPIETTQNGETVNVYTPVKIGKVNPVLNIENNYTSYTITDANKHHYTLKVELVAQWDLCSQKLTITPPSGLFQDDAVSIYKVTCRFLDNGIIGSFGSTLVHTVGNTPTTMLLPDGAYQVELLTDWGWRHYNSQNVQISKPVTVSSYYTDDTAPMRNPDKDVKVGYGIFKTEAGIHYRVAKPDLDSCSFEEFGVNNSYWLNGYGHATYTAPAPVVEATTEPAA